MRTTLRRLPLLASLAWLGMLAAQAQPQWRFHLAFEDGSGARDTLWFIYDTAATTGATVDYELGEGPMPMGDGAFHVYALNAQGDSATTIAWPYTLFPYFETLNTIEAINWVPPMTIRWDTSLFHAPYLPYEQGSFGVAVMSGLALWANSNDPILGGYNMLIDNSVTVSQFWDYLFPFSVYFGEHDGVGISDVELPTRICPWPNPAGSTLYFAGKGVFSIVRIVDMAGHIVRHIENHPAMVPVDVGDLYPGMYVVQIVTDRGHVLHGSFVKA